MSETFTFGFLKFGSLDLGLYGKYILVIVGIVALLLILPFFTNEPTQNKGGSKKKAAATTPVTKSPRKKTSASKGELGTIFSPEGRRSTRNRK